MPVIEHPVCDNVVSSSNDLYGCWGRLWQDGYYGLDRFYENDGSFVIRVVFIKNNMSRECRYDHSLSDAKCFDCRHRGSGEKYNERIRKEGLK